MMKTFLRIICRFLCMSTRYLSRLPWECSFLLPYQMCLFNMLRKYNKYMTEPSERWCQIIKKLLKLLKIGLIVLQKCQCNTEVLKLIFSLAKSFLCLNIYTTNIKTTNVCFNVIILVGWGWQFLFAIVFSFHDTHPLFKPNHSKYFFMHCSHDFLGQPFFLFPS